jgi:hypothetical protein
MAAVMTTPLTEAPLPGRGGVAGTPRRPHLTLVAPPRATAVRPGSACRESARREPAATYRRRRLVAVVVVVAVLALVVVVAGRAGAALGGTPLAASERPPSAPTEYVVQPGDSLWAIAAALAPGEDPRPVVDRLLRIHGRGPLQPGETFALR